MKFLIRPQQQSMHSRITVNSLISSSISSITCDHCRQHQKSQRRALHLPGTDHLPPALLAQPFSVYPCKSTVRLCFQPFLQHTAKPSEHNETKTASCTQNNNSVKWLLLLLHIQEKKTAFQSKTDLSHMGTLGYSRITSFLLLWSWPWPNDLDTLYRVF